MTFIGQYGIGRGPRLRCKWQTPCLERTSNHISRHTSINSNTQEPNKSRSQYHYRTTPYHGSDLLCHASRSINSALRRYLNRTRTSHNQHQHISAPFVSHTKRRSSLHAHQLSFILQTRTPDMERLLRQAADRRAKAFRPGTTANHERYMRSYVAFCLQYQVDDLAPTANQLSAFVEFLLHSGIAPSTVPNFLAGVKHYLQTAGMDYSVLMSYTLSLTLRSLKIDFTAPPNRKPPLSLQNVQKLVDYCGLKGLLGFTLRLAILLGFFGLLRISNLAPISRASFDPTRDSTRGDLILEPPGLQYTQRWAKNRQLPLQQADTPQVPIVTSQTIRWTQCKRCWISTTSPSQPLCSNPCY